MNISLSQILDFLNSLYGVPRVVLVLFICMQVELEPDGVSHHQRSPGIGFFKILGIGLTVIGFGGFLYFHLD